MAKATFILGLCGSGKTHLSDQLQKETGAEVFEGLVDKWEPDFERLLQCLTNGRDCIVEEISLCLATNRDKLLRLFGQHVPYAQIEWICFENDLESANWNVMQRTNKSSVAFHLEINQRVHDAYTYPEICTLVPITRIPASLEPPHETN